MSLPKPPLSLDNSCSVIHGNTLYSYSPQGFLSLPLEENAKWKTLDVGAKVTGGACVGTNPVNAADAALFIVGGTSDAPAYTGLQKYTFATGNWTTVTPSVPVTQNRLLHGATYIQADDSILVYAGSQDGSTGPSTQTFTIRASEPYAALSFQSSAAPAISPILMSWSNADAAMISGDGVDGKIYWFNPTAGWRDSGAGLSPPLNKAGGAVNVALVSGEDGSKNLYTFDLSKSPNGVSRTIVQDAAGNPLANSAPLAARDLDVDSESFEKRALTLSNWPEYNSTFAPKDTRTNFAIAQSDDGTVVFSGGNAAVPLAIFNVNQNGWVNAAELLGDQKQLAQDVSSTTTNTKTKTTSSSRTKSTTHSTSTTRSSASTTLPSSTSATATQTADFVPTDLSIPALPTGSGSASDDSGPSSNAILGITLGAIGGFLALLGLILLLLRCRRRQLLHPEAGKPKTPLGDEKNTTAFAAQNTFAKSTLPPHVQKQLRGHQKTASSESTSSMAILMGRVGQHKPRKLSNEFKSTISKPILQPQQAPILQIQDEKGDTFDTSPTELRPQDGLADDGTRRSSGWNKYWSGGSALGILGYGSAQAPPAQPSVPPPVANRDTLASDRSSHYSQTPTTRNVRKTQDSATVPPLNFEAPPGMNRVNTGSPVVSSYPNIPWREGMSGTIERPISAVSALSATSSGYSSGIPESIQETWDPTHAGKAWGADRAPSSAYTASAQPHALGVSKQPQLSTASTSNDMSWLNLGENSRV
ncbi:hypothetical protein V8C42DRAFT_344275 [Trichoderma barbatum]